MPDTAHTEPVEDSVPKIDNAVAVGEDLEFQKRWWRFEHIVWWIFAAILLADVAGAFGRGYLAKAQLRPSDGSFYATYERVERNSTPSIMTVHFGPAAVQNGQVRLYVSESLIQKLGNQRISPQPLTSVIGDDGITYTFAAVNVPATVEFALEPSFPGRQHFTMQVPGFAAVQANVFVVP